MKEFKKLNSNQQFGYEIEKWLLCLFVFLPILPLIYLECLNEKEHMGSQENDDSKLLWR